MVNQLPVILILGPTAGGKTELAVELARRIPGGGECICADSMQIYRGLDIGTAKPAPELRARVPHHLLDLLEPSEDGFTVDRWLELADRTIAEVRSRERVPIIVGGTNLYVQAFLFGLFEGPEPEPRLRAELEALSAADQRARLEAADPQAAARIHPNDRKRSIRAIEVFQLIGQRISDLQQQWSAPGMREDVLIIGLEFPVEAINRRINARVKRMMEKGFLEEVTRLRQAGLGRQAREALGYKQLIEFLEGRCSLEVAIEQIKIRTRRFAKQQRTWLRRFHTIENSFWVRADEISTQDIVNKAVMAMTATGVLRASTPEDCGQLPPSGRNFP